MDIHVVAPLRVNECGQWTQLQNLNKVDFSPARSRFLVDFLWKNLFPFSSNRRKNLKYRSLENNCHLVHFQDQSHPQETFNEHLKAQVWKLRDGSFEERESPLLSPVINSFTLQETLFIEQLTAIDERVRFQVRDGCEVM